MGLTKEATEEAVRKAARDLFDALNSGWSRETAPAFIDEFHRLHRTLQQGLFREIIIPLIKDTARREHWDLRNEDTVMLCRKIVEALGDDTYLRYI